MIGTHGYYDLAFIVVRWRGYVVPNENPRYMKMEYQDKKIAVTAFYDHTREEFVRVYVRIALPSDTPTTPPNDFTPFAIISDNTETDTLVFDGRKGDTNYYRPGRWVGYLKTIRDEIMREADKLQSLNGQSVDDTALFEAPED